MKVRDRFQDAEVIAWTELPRVSGCAIEGATVCGEAAGLFVVWWIVRNRPGGTSHAHQGYYTSDMAKAARELSDRISRHLVR